MKLLNPEALQLCSTLKAQFYTTGVGWVEAARAGWDGKKIVQRKTENVGLTRGKMFYSSLYFVLFLLFLPHSSLFFPICLLL